MSFNKYLILAVNQKIVAISFPKLLLEELDYLRGDIPRSKNITRLLENKLKEGEKQENENKNGCSNVK